jgi:DNA primase
MTVREMLDRTDLASVLTELAGAPAGQARTARWHCFVPSHEDRDPSVTMFVDRRGIERWRCWSDGHAGTAVDAVMIARGVGLGAAIEWLNQRDPGHTPPAPRQPAAASRQPLQPLSAQLKRWVNECEHRLWRPDGEGALEWLRRRGLSDTVLRANRIGYDPGHHVAARTFGLPRWRGITICSFHPDGELAYAQVRNLDGNAPSKYTNPTPRHGAVPALTFPRGAPRGGPIVVTEGILDGLSAVDAGFRAASLISTAQAAVSGGRRSPAAELLREHAHGCVVVLALDGDPAGRAATTAIRQHLHDVDVRVLRIPDGHDLTTLRTRKDQPCNTPTQTHPPATARRSCSA